MGVEMGEVIKIIVIVVLIIVAIGLVVTNIRIVPQARAYVIERLGAYKGTWQVGLHFKVPLIDKISRKVSLKEKVIDFPPQPVITKDNVTMEIDTVIYFQITDPKLYAYGVESPMDAIENLTATTLRNIIGELELDESLTSRETINTKIRIVLDEATDPWGIKINRVEVKNITPPRDIQQAMEKQMRAEREKRALIAQSEGEMQARINMAEGAKAAAIAESEGKLQAMKNQAEGDAVLIRAVAQATADGLATVADQMEKPGGTQAANLRVAENYLEQFGKLAKEGNTMILPTDLANISGLVSSLTSVIKQAKA